MPGSMYGTGLFVGSSTESYRPFSSAADATTSLNVEPGASGCRSARSTIGLSGSASSFFQVSPSFVPLMSDGS